ncbi:MAG: TIGR02266 family protein [Myxococcales bacterium]|nr:TIGR02266 family protein [Myxococcales bacterium]
MAEKPQGAVGLAARLPFASAEEFLAKYGANLTRGGVYLRSRMVKAPGTVVNLDLRLANGTCLIHAQAVVQFVTGQKGTGVPGMGLKFLLLDQASQRFVDSAAASLPHGKSADPPVPPGVGPAEFQKPGGIGSPAPASAGASAAKAAPAAAHPPGPAPKAPAMAASVGSAAPVITAPPFEEPKEEPKRQGAVIGIDLGTTNSCAAIVRNNRPEVLLSREGYNTVPSIIALNARGKLVVGHPAKGQMLTNPRLTVYGAKRLVGRPFNSPTVQQIKDRFHYEIADGPKGEAAVKLGDRVYSLQQISALVLREVREIAQNQIGQEVSRAVITVPAYYNDHQRQAVRESGRLAGLYVERILNEPTSAALAYGYGRKLQQRVLVYDLGGGTFDASVLELNDNIYEVVSTGGDTFLGGIDFDNALVSWLLVEFERKNGLPFQGDRVAMQRIADAAERAKCVLSERRDTRVHVPFVTMIDNKPYDIDITLSRDKLVELTTALVDRTIAVCKEVLAAKGLTPANIDEVILVGGQSRAPLVQQKVSEFFGKAPSKSVHPDEAVALGAALLAYSLGQLEGVLLIDVLPMAIGVGLPGGRFKPIIERNTSLPANKSYTIATARDGQTELELSLFQGDRERAQDNEYLGTLTLSGLPKGPRGSIRVGVTFEVNNECILKVTARELSTGREVSSSFSTRDTPEAVKQRIAQASSGTMVTGEHPAVAAPAPAKGSAPQLAPAPLVAAAAKSGGLLGWFKRLFGRA